MNLSESQSTRLDVHAYVRECDLYLRRVMAFAGVTILTVILCFAVVLPFRDQIRDSLADRFGMPAAELAIGLTPTPALLVMFIGILWLQRTANRTPELNCPMCEKSIVGMKHLVVAAKCCPHCGVRILNDVE
ncbi:MAG: hypothetical protein MUC43_17565 [Pirellula sp.]|nr:hypothetical protein [Pirellula sp.]